MNKALTLMMFILVLMPSVAQTASQHQPEASQNQVPQTKDAIANEPQEQTSQWTEPSSTTVTVTSTPLPSNSARKEDGAESAAKRPSKEDWSRCVQNEKCRPRNLYNNKWDWMFGPGYELGN